MRGCWGCFQSDECWKGCCSLGEQEGWDSGCDYCSQWKSLCLSLSLKMVQLRPALLSPELPSAPQWTWFLRTAETAEGWWFPLLETWWPSGPVPCRQHPRGHIKETTKINTKTYWLCKIIQCNLSALPAHETQRATAENTQAPFIKVNLQSKLFYHAIAVIRVTVRETDLSLTSKQTKCRPLGLCDLTCLHYCYFNNNGLYRMQLLSTH